MAREIGNVKQGGIFDQARNGLKALNAEKSNNFALQIANATQPVDLRVVTSPRIVAPLTALLLVAVGGSAAALSAKESAGPMIINPLPGLDSGCVDHAERSPYIPYNHTDLRVPFPLAIDNAAEVRIRLIESDTQRVAETPLSEAMRLGAAKAIKGKSDDVVLEVHDYLPGFVDGERTLKHDLKITPGKEYTLAIEYTGTKELFISSPVRTNHCSP